MKEIATPATQATRNIPPRHLQGKRLDPRIAELSLILQQNPLLQETILELSSPRTPPQRIRYLERTFRGQGVKRDVLAMFAKLRAFDESTL